MDILMTMRNSFYDNVDPRRKQELTDSRKVQEDHTKMANCSENGYQRQFNPDEYVEKLSMYNQSTRTK